MHLRPADVIEYFKERAQTNQSDLMQLLDGLQIGGTVVIGGAPANAATAARIAQIQQRIGNIVSIAQIDRQFLDGRVASGPVTFDLAAIAQLMMIARNEAFHDTMAQVISMAEALRDNGQTLDVAIAILQEQDDKIQRM